MKGDFSRIRFTPGQHFTSVLQQQGRVSLDADANEQCAIDEYLRGVQTIDTLGDVGGPRDDAGFGITVEDASARIHIYGGRYYVHGLLCESSATDYMDQRYLVNPSVTDEDLLKELVAGKIDAICVELQVWQRLVTALDDPCLLEPALNQADTTARLQTVWRVVASPVSTLAERVSVLRTEKPGKLCAKVSNTSNDCSCQPIPPAGYQGLENQLYRVEIHQAGDETTATFKWSRENASIVAAITGSSTNNGQTTILVDSLGKDANLGFAANQWVEIGDDTKEFGDTPNQSGQFWQIASVSAAGQPPSITFNTIIPAVNLGYNPRVRRWDQPGTATAGDIPLSANTPIDIENGIQVTFTAGKYWSGDYWLIPARTASGTIDWPPCGSDKNCYQPADYIHLYTAPLAFITAPARAARDLAKAEILPLLVEDLRSFFAPLSASAMHIENFSWTNDDLMTLDRLLIDGLRLLLDRVPTSPVDASVFRVSLEIPQWTYRFNDETNELVKVAKLQSRVPSNAVSMGLLRQEFALDGIISLQGRTLTWTIPTDAGQENDPCNFVVYQLNTLLQEQLDALWSLFPYQALPGTVNVSASAIVTGTGTTFTASVQAGQQLVFGADTTQTVYAIASIQSDTQLTLTQAYSGTASANSSATIFSPPDLTWYARVRVRVLGRMIYLRTAGTSGQCGQTKTLFLDGQCFGEPRQRSDKTPGVNLALPSGNSAMASDFESWFYLVPMPEVEGVTFNGENNGASIVLNPNLYGTITGTVTLVGPPVVTPTTISLVASLASLTGGAVSSAIAVTIPSTITIPIGNTSQTFTVVVQVPAAAASAPFTCTVTATPQTLSVLGEIFSAQGSFNVYMPLVITTPSPLPSGTYNTAYSTTLSATGGTPPYSWRIPSGKLPDNLILDAATGTISGMAITVGTLTFTVEVTDSEYPAVTATKQFSITVYEPLVITTAELPDATEGVEYHATVAATGGKPPYSWRFASSVSGTEFAIDGTTGEISAKLDITGKLTFTVQVRDSDSPQASASREFALTVNK